MRTGCSLGPRRSRARRALVTVAAGVLAAAATRAALPTSLPAPSPAPYVTAVRDGFRGERLVYRFGWLGIPAAEAQWSATPRSANGRPVLEVEARARTLAAIDPLWKLRSRVAATLAADPILPREFLLRDEDDEPRVSTLRFDHEQGTLTVTRTRPARPTLERQEPIAGQYDPVSAAFVLRGLPLRNGDHARLYVQTEGNVYRLDVEVLGRERITLGAKSFDAILLSPSLYDMKRDRPVKRLRSARLWLSDDARRIVLRLESDVFVGKVHAELVTQG